MSEHAPLNVFLSYSHKDEELKEKLDAHLSALKRSQVIQTWNDRKIVAGTDWKHEIDINLTHADVILLLISSDFLASEYCYATEMTNALERHHRGLVLVIPVMLRDVDFRGTPIETLQMLPKDARPVISSAWATEDEALKNVATGVRSAIAHFRRLRSDLDALAAKASAVWEDRHLDAAFAREIRLEETREVVVLLRLKDSKGLADTLPETLCETVSFSCTRADVRSEPFQAKYIVEDGKPPESPAYRLSLDAPGLKILDGDKKVQLEGGHDSAKLTFFVTAEEAGEQYLRVNLFRKDFNVGAVLLKSVAGGDTLPGGGGGWAETLVLSVRLTLNAIAKQMYA